MKGDKTTGTETEVILISGLYGMVSEPHKLAEGVAALYLIQWLDRNMPGLQLQKGHRIAAVVWKKKRGRGWKQMKKRAKKAGVAFAGKKLQGFWIVAGDAPELFKKEPLEAADPAELLHLLGRSR